MAALAGGGVSILLAVDTATEACSVALWLDGAVHERWELAGRTHSQRLLPLLHELLAEAGVVMSQVDGIACGVGPGSFAGVRIGVGFVKGLALGLDRQVLPVTSLAMLAQGAIRVHGARQVLAAIDARMDEVYFCAYAERGGLAAPLGEAMVAPPAGLELSGEGEWHAAGSGWKTHLGALRAGTRAPLRLIDGEALPHASDALPLAAPAFAAGRGVAAGELSPLYLRNRVALTKAEQEAARKAP
jgi:tRNA threonylcarbamoyladenosine biosynthesis protein TsaB